MISTICLSISFIALSVVVFIFNVRLNSLTERLNSLTERLNDISKDKVGKFEYSLLESDVTSLVRWKRSFNAMYDYLSLKDRAISARAKRLAERERQKNKPIEVIVEFNPKYNSK